MGKLGALEHRARMTVLCVNAQRQKPCCSVACFKVSLIGAENKGETACLRAKSHVPAHLIQAPPHARIVQALLPLLLSASDASSPRKRFQAFLIHSNMHAPSFSPNCGQRARNTEGGCPGGIQLPLTSRPLPERFDLRHLKGEAKTLKRSGQALPQSAALFQIAHDSGFLSWPSLKAKSQGQVSRPSLKAHVESLQTFAHKTARLK
jgi:hypothetical protein